MEPQKVLSTDLLDIIFEGRNKQYGAYELRRKYHKRALMALLWGILSVSLVFGSVGIYTWYKEKKEREEAEKKTSVDMADEIIIPVDIPPPPPPPPPDEPPPPPKNTIQYVPPKVEEDKKVVEETPPPPVDKITDQIANKTEEGDGKVKVPTAPVGDNPAPPVAAPAEEDNSIQNNAAVESPAEFPGGQTEMMKWIYANVKYPAIARENGIQGRVVVSFVVEKDGSISNPKVLKGVNELLDKEAVRVIKEMPKWKAGRQGEKNVRCAFTMPVSFKLEG
jgi:periplasmic protein TonB